MPILNKEQHEHLMHELVIRFSNLRDAFDSRELKNNYEGIKGRGHWLHPERQCATKASNYELRLVIDDFKNILSEIRKL